MVVLLVLLAVVAAIVLIIVRPGASQGEEPAKGDVTSPYQAFARAIASLSGGWSTIGSP